MHEMPEYKEKAGTCADCGNSPTPHMLTYILATADVWSAHLAYRLSSSRLSKNVLIAAGRIGHLVERLNYRSMHTIGFLRMGNDPTKARSYRSQVVWEEAIRAGIPMEQLMVFKSASDVYRARVGEDWIYFESLPIPNHFHHTTYLWIDDKYRLNAVLKAAEIPVPYLATVTTVNEAYAAFAHTKGRAVAKPRAGSRGRHTTTNITSEDQLREAFSRAQALCRYVCITRHLEGSVCRGTVVGGKLVGFFQANPPRITGDGTSTIEELIAQKNALRHERVQPIVLSNEHEAYLRRAGLSRDSVLASGESFDLTHRTGRLFGGETRELLTSVHPKLRAYLERAAAVLQVPVVGFDLIIVDPEKDPDTQEWGIIEANSLPFIDLHYLPLHGEPSNVAASVWALWDAQNPARAGS